MKRSARVASYVIALGLATAATSAAAFDASPDGIWTGTVICKGRTPAFYNATFNPGPIAVCVPTGCSYALVENRFGTGDPDAVEIGQYYPDPSNPNKGKVGFALVDAPFEASETGELSLERNNNSGAVKMNGNSYVLAAIPGGPFSGKCEYKLQKVDNVCPLSC
jgi:hypothetical protein